MINFVVSLGKPLSQTLDELRDFIEHGAGSSKQSISCRSSLAILTYNQTTVMFLITSNDK